METRFIEADFRGFRRGYTHNVSETAVTSSVNPRKYPRESASILCRYPRLSASIVVILFVLVVCTSSYAQEAEAQAEAEKYHKLATSDVVYSDEELKALYYQNKTMIELLREIKELLRQQLIQTREKKGE